MLRSLVPLKHNPRLAVNRFLATRLRQQLKPDTVARDISHVRWVLKLWEVKDAVIEASLTAIRRGLKENEVLLPKAKALPMSRAVLNQFLNHKRIPKPVKVVIKQVETRTAPQRPRRWRPGRLLSARCAGDTDGS